MTSIVCTKQNYYCCIPLKNASICFLKSESEIMTTFGLGRDNYYKLPMILSIIKLYWEKVWNKIKKNSKEIAGIQKPRMILQNGKKKVLKRIYETIHYL